MIQIILLAAILFIFFLKRGTHVSWESSNERIQGINWAQSRKAVTRGIWMWNTPYRVKRRDGSEVRYWSKSMIDHIA